MACWDCRRSIVRHWEDDVHRQFAGAENTECSVITVVLACTAAVETIRAIVAKARWDFGSLRAGMYRQPGGWRWRSVRAFGMVEAGAVVSGGSAPMTPERRALLPVLHPVAFGDGDWWLPIAHLAVHHPYLDRAELAQAVLRRWPGPERADVRPFGEHQPAAENAADVVRHALERLGPVGGFGWPPPRRADFHGWLFSLRRGLQPLGMSLRPGREIDAPCAADTAPGQPLAAPSPDALPGSSAEVRADDLAGRGRAGEPSATISCR